MPVYIRKNIEIDYEHIKEFLVSINPCGKNAGFVVESGNNFKIVHCPYSSMVDYYSGKGWLKFFNIIN